MASSISDSKPNIGLANALSNVFKLADVNGLKWVRYVGPNSNSLEAPREDPVLTSYARLLNQGYACSWRRLSPSTDGLTGETKDLWIFYFTDLPDISDTLAKGLKEDASGSWEDGMTSESSTMLYRSLHNIIERSLISENFLPLGKWFVRPDSSVATDGSSRGCFLCGFSFFVHAHLYICASVDMKAGPSLQPLLPSHINQALASSTGLQVVLSPSGLNACMTGHSYKMSDSGIGEILEEWKLFYPQRFEMEASSGLPAAIEVVLGGVRMRYPSQFVFVYHGDDLPAPPPCSLDDKNMEEVMQETWITANCVDTLQQQRESALCRCNETRGSMRRQSSQLDLSLRPNPRHASSSSSGRYEPYSRKTRAKELATPGSLNLMNQPALTANKLSRHLAVPKYTTPMSSPGLLPSLSPTMHGKMTSSASSTGMSLPLPSISLNSATTTTSSSGATPVSISTCPKSYDQSKVPPSYLKSSSPHLYTHSTASHSISKTFPAQQQQQQQQQQHTEKWWDSLALPDSLESLGGLQLPRYEGMRVRANGSQGSPGLTPTTFANLISPNSAKKNTSSRKRSSVDHGHPIGTPLRGGVASSPGGNLYGPPFPGSNGSKRLSSISKPTGGGRGKGRGKKVGEMGYPGYADGFEGLDSPMSVDGGDAHLHINGGEGMDEFFPTKPHGIDVFSDKVVKIEAMSLDQIFDSDEEDEECADSNHYPFLDPMTRVGGEEKMNGTSLKHTKLSASEPIELSRIYPTPPSVENTEFEEVKMTRTDGTDHVMSNFLLENGFDEDLVHVPVDFLPLQDVLCFSACYQLPQQLLYHKATAKITPTTSNTSATHKDLTAQSFNSEPEKFIFPPPTSFSSRAPAKESLTLPLSQRQIRFSPHTLTPHATPTNLSSLGSSPAYPYPRAPGRPALPRHLPSASTLTPLESPFDPIPTPMSATTNRLIPVLPEANGLYINLALLDSALGSNLSETLQISNVPRLSTIHNFMKFSSMRMKLDSVADPFDSNGMGSTTDLLNCQDEKPMMTFGVADYPSLGFKEELAGVGALPQEGSCDKLYGSLSKFILNMHALENPEKNPDPDSIESDSILSSFPMERFLELLQDYCLHVCLTCNQNGGDGTESHASFQERKQHAHLLRQPDWSDDTREKSLCRLYYSHSVVSAILSAKQLVMNGRKGGGGMGTPLLSKGVTLTREDNSGAWILDLLTLPTKFITKRLKELKSVLQNSFHHAPCLKFTTKGPLTLKDLQQLTPSMTALGDECSPLPMKPVVVGYDHEWLSLSPLALPSWDKLLLEPYSMRKSVVYLVIIPSSVSNESIRALPLKKYFRDLSLVYKNCQLGQHVPLEKGLGEDGVVFTSSPLPKDTSASPDASTAGDSETKDPHTNTRHGEPAGVGDLHKFCKEVLASYLSSLPEDSEEIISTYSSSAYQDRSGQNSKPRTPPLSIVLYVLCANLHRVAKPATPTSSLTGLHPDPSGCASSANSVSCKERMECLRTMKVFSQLLDSEDLPEFVQERLVVQLLDPKELMGSSSGCSGQLRSLAFSVYTRCRPQAEISIEGARSLTTFGPIADRLLHNRVYPYRQIFAPPFILSSEPPLSSTGPVIGTQHRILLDPEEPVLFCGYCVSPDRRWMLVVCCDRQGELLDTSIIGIPYTGGFDIDNSRFMALQKLWAYLVSLVSSSLHCWSIVITRFGKPSTSEISNWPRLILDDGLLTANQVLRDDCTACSQPSKSRPHISNVIILSVQPERNIQLFPSSDPTPSVSHVIVLPQDPSAAPPPGQTPLVPDQSQDDALVDIFGGGMAAVEDMATDDGFGSELRGINIHDEIQNLVYSSGTEDTSPKATGYLISTSPPGDLPMEFWGHDRPQSFCSMFKVLLHCHRSEDAIPLSPQETLGSTLLCFDALSWLTMDHSTRQRRTCLPIHLFILSKLYHLFSTLEMK